LADKDLKINDSELDIEAFKNTPITQQIFKAPKQI
jgi:hypothetical protein